VAVVQAELAAVRAQVVQAQVVQVQVQVQVAQVPELVLAREAAELALVVAAVVAESPIPSAADRALPVLPACATRRRRLRTVSFRDAEACWGNLRSSFPWRQARSAFARRSSVNNNLKRDHLDRIVL